MAKTINELIHSLKTTHPDHPAVIFSSPSEEETTYTTTDINTYTTHAAHLYTHRYDLHPRSPTHPKTVVGVLAPTTPEYLITILAIARQGHAVLLLSPRLADDVCGYLLREAGARLLLVGHGRETLYRQVQKQCPSLVVGVIARHEEYAFQTETEISINLDCDREEETVWILHSSGSTGLPKLVYVTNRSALARYADAVDLLGKNTLSTLPMFHAYGMTAVFRMLYCGGRTVQMWNPCVPVTTASLVKAARKRKFGLFATMPAVLKMLAEEEQGVEFLRQFEVVTSGGSPLAEGVGEFLVREGVRVVSIYGMFVCTLLM